MTAPLILAFDTSGAYCAVALIHGDTVLHKVNENMVRGQAERLMGLLIETLATESANWQDLSALAVGVGPGNFTGIRIGISAARGLALGLSIPAYGVNGFIVRETLAKNGTTVAIPATRDTTYVLDKRGPVIMPMAEVSRPASDPNPADLALAIAKHAKTLWPAPTPPPAPYYIKMPGAAPAKDTAPKLLP